jgi:hypothetical protein
VLVGGDATNSSSGFSGADGSVFANVDFETPNSEPVLSGTTDSIGNNVRLGSNGGAFYTYTNSTNAPVPLIISASLTYDSSSASLPVANGNTLPGGASYEATVSIISVNYLDEMLYGSSAAANGLNLPADLAYDFNLDIGASFISCEPAGTNPVGVYAYGEVDGATSGGPGSFSVSSSACGGDGGAYSVAPGQTVIILEGFHFDSNRGGEIDPLTERLTNAPTPNALNIAAPIPEPATWLAMLIGFAGIGAALRLQRARSAVA